MMLAPRYDRLKARLGFEGETQVIWRGLRLMSLGALLIVSQ
jgi:hypothetical protein